MIDPKALEDCRRLAFQVAPELKANPVYIVDVKLMEGLPQPAGCLGWARQTGHLDYDTLERLSEQWQGPGPIIALDGEAIREGDQGNNFPAALAGVFVHELAHCLPAITSTQRRSVGDVMDHPTVREFQRMQLAQAIEKPASEPGSIDDAHNDQFIRRACHLYSRAIAAGWDVCIDDLLGGACWFCPQPAHWIISLLKEVHSMREATFAEIEAQAPPKEFAAMWKSALAFYQSFQEREQKKGGVQWNRLAD